MGSDQIVENKTVTAHALGGEHANRILRGVWCHLIWPELAVLPVTKCERNSERGGGERKLGVRRSSLTTAGRRGHVHRERLKPAISGPAPSCHTITSSPFIHLSPPHLQSPHQESLCVWSDQVLRWRTEAVRWVGVSDRAVKERIAEENGCSGCCPLISLVCDCAMAGVCSVCRRMRVQGVNCV